VKKPRRRLQKQRRAEKRWAAAWFSGDRTRDRELAAAGALHSNRVPGSLPEVSRPPSRHNRSYCAVCHESRRPSELPVRDLRRIDPKRTTDFDDEYADSCDSIDQVRAELSADLIADLIARST
jgi:hypothetical protein